MNPYNNYQGMTLDQLRKIKKEVSAEIQTRERMKRLLRPNEETLVCDWINIIEELSALGGKLSGYSFDIYPAFLQLFKKYPQLKKQNIINDIMLWLARNRPKAYKTLNAIQRSPHVTFGSTVIARSQRLQDMIKDLHKILSKARS